MTKGAAEYLIGAAEIAVMAVQSLVLFAVPILAGVFLVSGLMKLRDDQSFDATLATLGIQDRRMRQTIARTLPAVELGLGLVLALDQGRPLSTLATAGLLATFTAVLAYARFKALAISCGCFGPGNLGPVSLAPIARNLVLILLALFVSLPINAEISGLTPLSPLIALCSVAGNLALAEFLNLHAVAIRIR